MHKSRRIVVMALFIAITMIGGLLYYYGTSNPLLVRNTLISPDILEKSASHLGRHKVEFTQVEMEGRKWRHFAIPYESYAAFYHMVAGLKNIAEITDDLVQQFETTTPSTLTIVVWTQESSDPLLIEKLFQRVEFIDRGDLFRVLMKQEQGEAEEWVYFKYSGICDKVVTLFTPQRDVR